LSIKQTTHLIQMSNGGADWMLNIKVRPELGTVQRFSRQAANLFIGID